MDTEKQKNFIIHFLYYILLVTLFYFFFRYVIYSILPFLIGFLIAFLLHPIIKRLSKYGYTKAWSFLVITIFYSILGILLTMLSLKGFFYIKEWLTNLPLLYQDYVEPYIQNSLSNVESVWKSVDVDTAQIFSSIIDGLQSSLSSLITMLSKSILDIITNFASGLPNIIISFFFSIMASFFINADYQKITSFFTRQCNAHTKEIIFSTKQYICETMGQLMIAYGKLMFLTFFELLIGLKILNVEHFVILAFAIALFDIIPVLGTGGIMIPWAMLVFLNQQSKLAVGLCILYLIITIIRNIIEPRLVGKQIGLHPLLMLLCMYIGAKFFGVLGILVLPFFILIMQNLHKLGLLNLFK